METNSKGKTEKVYPKLYKSNDHEYILSYFMKFKFYV